jgi:hypothetical protein
LLFAAAHHRPLHITCSHAIPKHKDTPNDHPRKTQRPHIVFPVHLEKYGQPIAHWLDLLNFCDGMKHMEMVAWLNTEQGMGHGHANAIVAYGVAAKK